MDAEKAYEILRNYKTEHEKDMSPDEREAFNMALLDIGAQAQVDAEALVKYGPANTDSELVDRIERDLLGH